MGEKQSPPVTSPVPFPALSPGRRWLQGGWEQRRRKRRVWVLSRKEGSSQLVVQVLGRGGEFLGVGRWVLGAEGIAHSCHCLRVGQL